MNTYFTDIIIILHQNTWGLPGLPALVQQCFCSIIFNNRFKSLKYASSRMKHVDFELIILGQQLFLAGQHLEHLQVHKNSNKAQTQHQLIKIYVFLQSVIFPEPSTITNWKSEVPKPEHWCLCLLFSPRAGGSSQDDLGRYSGKNTHTGFSAAEAGTL